MRSHRLELRLAESDRALLDRATAKSGESVSEFVRTAVRDRATDVLGNDVVIALAEGTAAAFLSRLDQIDERTVSRLADLHRRASASTNW